MHVGGEAGPDTSLDTCNPFSPVSPHPNCRNRAVCGSGGLRTSVWASVRFIEGEAGDRRAVDGSGRDGRAGQEGVSGVVCGVI